MAKKIKFPLKMKNGAEVRTFDELKENFDLESVLGYFADERLATWLADRYYDEKAKAVSVLSADTPDLNAKLCEILEVEYKAEEDSTDLKSIQRRNEKLRILSVFTDDKGILNNIDIVAMDQNELFDILDEEPERVFLYGEKFDIPFGKKNVLYIGLNNPLVILDSNKDLALYKEAGIILENVKYEKGINTSKKTKSSQNKGSTEHKSVKTIKTEKELGEAIKNKQNHIEIEGDLCKKVIRIKAAGAVAWKACIGGLSVAIGAAIATVWSAGTAAPVTITATTVGIVPSIAAFGGGSIGLSVASSAVLIGAAGGGVATLNELRKYNLEEKEGRVILFRE